MSKKSSVTQAKSRFYDTNINVYNQEADAMSFQITGRRNMTASRRMNCIIAPFDRGYTYVSSRKDYHLIPRLELALYDLFTFADRLVNNGFDESEVWGVVWDDLMATKFCSGYEGWASSFGLDVDKSIAVIEYIVGETW